MSRIIASVLIASAVIFGVFLPREKAVAQTAKELVGMWTLVSVTLEQDGKKIDMYGANPQGQAIFAPNGRFSIMFIRSDVPKFVSTNREAGTPEENKAAVQGSIAYFGTYSVSETDKVIMYHIEGSTFPNWRDIDQKRFFKLSGDELTLTNPTPSTGFGTGNAVWQRVK
jgi:Lipocalin-like domain